MVKHIVCFKLKPNVDVNKTAEVLRSMKGNVKEIVDIEVGVDFLKSERSYDIILQVTLKDKKSLQDYQNNEYHCSVVKKHMHAVRESSIAEDYEF